MKELISTSIGIVFVPEQAARIKTFLRKFKQKSNK
jgi:hypothetical protein